MTPLLIRPDSAAERLNISGAKMYRHIRAGDIPHVRLGRSVRIPMEALYNWIALLQEESVQRVPQQYR